MEFIRYYVVSLFLVLCVGCASPARYDWGTYSSDLYQDYNSPTAEQAQKFINVLDERFERVESRGTLPAPGLYAEYATLKMQQGDNEKAIEYFQKERTAWPESTVLMDALIAALSSDAAAENYPQSEAMEKDVSGE